MYDCICVYLYISYMHAIYIYIYTSYTIIQVLTAEQDRYTHPRQPFFFCFSPRPRLQWAPWTLAPPPSPWEFWMFIPLLAPDIRISGGELALCPAWRVSSPKHDGLLSVSPTRPTTSGFVTCRSLYEMFEFQIVLPTQVCTWNHCSGWSSSWLVRIERTVCFATGHDPGIFDCSDRVVLFAPFKLGNPVDVGDLGVPLFQETTTSLATCSCWEVEQMVDSCLRSGAFSDGCVCDMVVRP